MKSTMVSTTKHKKPLFEDTPRGILEALLLVGGMAVVLSAAPTIFLALTSIGFVLKEDKRQKRKLSSSFQYLQQRKYIKRHYEKGEMSIELTKEGRKHIDQYLNRRRLSRPLEQPNIWDKKWRLILFDIPSGERTKRNAFRGLIRRLGAVMFQKSVWLYPYDCAEQISLLRDLFRFGPDELCLVVADSIGEDKKFRAHFRI